jgi:hypothetical protein
LGHKDITAAKSLALTWKRADITAAKSLALTWKRADITAAKSLATPAVSIKSWFYLTN